jgi:hypothetical protein
LSAESSVCVVVVFRVGRKGQSPTSWTTTRPIDTAAATVTINQAKRRANGSAGSSSSRVDAGPVVGVPVGSAEPAIPLTLDAAQGCD